MPASIRRRLAGIFWFAAFSAALASAQPAPAPTLALVGGRIIDGREMVEAGSQIEPIDLRAECAGERTAQHLSPHPAVDVRRLADEREARQH